MLLALTTLAAVAYAASAAEANAYATKDIVPVLANKVGPFANPHETYKYYSLPFCPPSVEQRQDHNLGEVLAGDRKVLAKYEVRFRTNVDWRLLCEKTLSQRDIGRLMRAIEEEYYFEFFIDGLPVWGYIGDMVEDEFLLGQTSRTRHYLYTHLHFSLGFNGDRVVEANVTTNPSKRVELTGRTELATTFSYSVSWRPVSIPYERRYDRYHHSSFVPGAFEIHWLSVINSFILVVVLTAFLAVILMRVLRNDFAEYISSEDREAAEEESGWKLLHGDVFRVPGHASVLAAVMGAGVHLLLTAFLLLVLSLLGAFHPTHRGSLLTAAITLYCLTSVVNGYVSARLYKQLGGRQWVWNVVMAALLFPLPLFVVFMFVNSAAAAHGATAALPFGTLVVVLSLFILLAFPLSVIGGIAGHNTSGDLGAPCRTKRVPRQIPAQPWYRGPVVHLLVGGFLPFTAIYVELYNVFASVWGHRIYTLFGILFIAFVMLLCVVSFLSVALTYFQLVAEDHRWWWRAFGSGAASGLFVFLYCFFYYFNHTSMFGFMQSSFFFGYTAIGSYAFALMMGALSFYSSLAFVRHIYASIKTE